MPVPAAASDASPLAVLVLAWDEATPAVRAVVEATQASTPVVDSILVMVPQADAPDHLSAEEYLPVPVPASEWPLVAIATPTPEPLPLPIAEPALPAVVTLVGEQGIVLQTTFNEVVTTFGEVVTPTIKPVIPVAAIPLTWTAVRVLRLGSLSLPQLAQRAGQLLPAPIWTGSLVVPAAPYLGTTVPAGSPTLPVTSSEPISNATFDTELHLLSEPLPLAAAEPASAPVALRATDVALLRTSPRYEPIEAAQGPDLEADLQPSAGDEPAAFESATSISVDNSSIAQPAPRAAAQADWAEALATLRQPATLPERPALPGPLPEMEPATAAPTAYPALRPAATHYPAPDLNFQIIQYARFAVPVALAEPPFAVVYAPAWPTWLAAQELRQRTGRPLVLHVSTLAAADDESVETATGWIAELQRQVLRRADLILTETTALAQRLRHDLGLPASAVQAVPATDTEAVAQALHTAQLRPTLVL